MSLLLDALKKAADDKQKAAQDRPTEETSNPNPVVTEKEPELTLQAGDDEVQSSAETEELTLDVLEADVTEPEVAKIKAEDDLQLEQDNHPDSPEQKSYTVSDEALSMLIYKTNRDFKKSRRLIIAGVMMFSLAILASGAAYYYMDMQSEIANLERKHQIAMQSMQSKTNKEKAPVQSEIIRNLVSEADLDDKVRYAKKRIVEKPARQQSLQQSPAVASGKVRNEAGTVSFQKTNKTDPITEKLDQAWQAYDDGRYDSAKDLYIEVLNSEESNRDALLGLGAIAVIEKDYVAARDIYMSLLKQDPRDPIAIAAISSLQSDGVSLPEDERFLQNMLQKNPNAAHLNFALGNVYAQQEKWKSAQQSYFNAWQQDIENADYIFNLAVSLDQLGKPEQALNLYRESLSKSNNKQVSFSREDVKQRITELSGL
jgi:tetratricopeptide (TPR) repeat protein